MKIDDFRSEFANNTKTWKWEVEGILDNQGYVHPIDLDTKVISTVFERLSSPVLRSISKNHGYKVETANQTTYPDFTLSKFTDDVLVSRIALDVKTTYVSNSMNFTLGSYNSFIRNNTKNILYPYNTYSEHWILGFVYRQKNAFDEYDLDNMPVRGQISCPYSDVYWFIRRKQDICGLRAGSGNTKNIGSIKVSQPSDFATKKGPFTQFSKSKEACDHFWANYENYLSEIGTDNQLIQHIDFQRFK